MYILNTLILKQYIYCFNYYSHIDFCRDLKSQSIFSRVLKKQTIRSFFQKTSTEIIRTPSSLKIAPLENNARNRLYFQEPIAILFRKERPTDKSRPIHPKSLLLVSQSFALCHCATLLCIMHKSHTIFISQFYIPSGFQKQKEDDPTTPFDLFRVQK